MVCHPQRHHHHLRPSHRHLLAVVYPPGAVAGSCRSSAFDGNAAAAGGSYDPDDSLRSLAIAAGAPPAHQSRRVKNWQFHSVCGYVCVFKIGIYVWYRLFSRNYMTNDGTIRYGRGVSRFTNRRYDYKWNWVYEYTLSMTYGGWQNLDTLIELTSLMDSYALMTLLSSWKRAVFSMSLTLFYRNSVLYIWQAINKRLYN